MDKGIKRIIDPLGRVVIPRSMRKDLEIVDGQTEISVVLEDGYIILKPCDKKEDPRFKEIINIINHEIAQTQNPFALAGMKKLKAAIKNALEVDRE